MTDTILIDILNVRKGDVLCDPDGSVIGEISNVSRKPGYMMDGPRTWYELEVGDRPFVFPDTRQVRIAWPQKETEKVQLST